MTDMSHDERRPGDRSMRCALFVDFDNVYSGLQKLDPDAATVFAKEPSHWLERLGAGEDTDGSFSRRFLIRACYLNPSVYSEFRPYFTRAGFRVIDCPSLTNQGKSSADINLALDAMDALGNATHYDEFVIFSADADFTPLALRCRAQDRRVTVALAGPAASAYRAVADVVIASDELVELLARPEPIVDPAPVTVVKDEDLAASAADAVTRRLRTAGKPLPSGSVAQAATAVDPKLPSGKWEGHGTFVAWLAASVPSAVYAPQPAPGYVWDKNRFSEDDLPGRGEQDPSSLQRQVVSVTDVPDLSAKQYAAVFTELAADVSRQPFNRTETSKRVRDACRDSGLEVGRAAINFIIQGLLYAGVGFQPPVTSSGLANAWADNVEGLCIGARMDLGPDDLKQLRAWVGGGLIAT